MTQEHEDDMQAEGEIMRLEELGTYEELSNCCGANMQGEPVNRIMHDDDIIEGRCADCKEMATFKGSDDED